MRLDQHLQSKLLWHNPRVEVPLYRVNPVPFNVDEIRSGKHDCAAGRRESPERAGIRASHQPLGGNNPFFGMTYTTDIENQIGKC